jgi:SOS-response transcriptional repressor LexA
MGDLEEAEKCYRQAQEVFSHIDACDTKWNAAIACYAGGMVCQCQGRWPDALARFDQALLGIKKSGHSNMQAGVERIRQRMFYLQDRYHQQRLQEEAENSIPVVGTSAAGYPMLAIPLASDDVFPDKIYVKGRACEVKRMLEVGRGNYLELPPGKNHFVVRVEGDSMIAIGIDDGDYVVFRQQPEVAQGEIAVVRIDDLDDARSTVKRFYRDDSKIKLRAENPDFQPREQVFGIKDPTLHVLGKAIATLAVRSDA